MNYFPFDPSIIEDHSHRILCISVVYSSKMFIWLWIISKRAEDVLLWTFHVASATRVFFSRRNIHARAPATAGEFSESERRQKYKVIKSQTNRLLHSSIRPKANCSSRRAMFSIRLTLLNCWTCGQLRVGQTTRVAAVPFECLCEQGQPSSGVAFLRYQKGYSDAADTCAVEVERVKCCQLRRHKVSYSTPKLCWESNRIPRCAD